MTTWNRFVVRGVALGSAAALLLAAPAVAATSTPGPDPIATPSTPAEVLAAPLQALADTGVDPAAPDAVRDVTGIPVNTPGGLDVVGENVTVSVRFADHDAQRAAVDAASELGTVISVTRSLPTLVLQAPTSSFDALADLPGVVSVIPAYRPAFAGTSVDSLAATTVQPAASCREIPVEADPVLRSDEARAAFGVDGTGVTVGVISDSFDMAAGAPTTPQEDVAMGSLPGVGNPCGYTTPVRVLVDSASASSDEGRAMLQNLHGIAPGAELLFATSGATAATFADAIHDLRAAGADVILDDVIRFDETAYQRGVVGSAVADVVADGATYLSAAGNFGSVGKNGVSAGQSTGAWESETFTGMTCPQMVLDSLPNPAAAVECVNFAPDGTANALLEAELVSVGTQFPLITHWSEPADAVKTAVFAYVFDANGTLVGYPGRPDRSLPNTTTHVQTGVGPQDQKTGDYRIALVRFNPGSGDIRTKLIFALDDGGVFELQYPTWPEGVNVGPAVFGHAADPAAIAVGAASVLTPDNLESFSSPGPATYLFDPVRTDGTPAPRLAEPQVTSKPDIVAVDMVRTSFFVPQPGEPTIYRFGGTSSATPIAGGVAALAVQHAGTSTAPSVIREALVGSGRPISGPVGFTGTVDENLIGGGLIDAQATLAALPAPGPSPTPIPTPEPTPEPTPTAAPTTSPAPAPTATHAPVGAGQLPRTGSDGTSAFALAFLGAAAVAGGGLIVLRRRARAQR